MATEDELTIASAMRGVNTHLKNLAMERAERYSNRRPITMRLGDRCQKDLAILARRFGNNKSAIVRLLISIAAAAVAAEKKANKEASKKLA